jgi:transposase
LAEAKKHQAWKLLRGIPFIGPIRAALLMALIQTPHRFRTKRQLQSYSGFGIETHSSAGQRFINGELRRAKKPVCIRGLNRNHNHDLKNLFKSVATVAAAKAGPFQEYYHALVAQGMRPEMARLTLARKIASIILIIWKKGARFEGPTSETTSSLSVSSHPFYPWDSSRAVARVLETLGFEGESQLIS